MKDTVDAKELEEMCNRGEIKDCIVGGPFALDNAVSEEAARHKGITSSCSWRSRYIISPRYRGWKYTI